MSFKGEKEGSPRAQSADFFLLNPPRQPKREIADYVEKSGILVPYRFANLDDALSSGKPFIVRSEHPQDYNGVSGLLKSFEITKELIGENRDEYGSDPEEIDWEFVFKENDVMGRRLNAEGQLIAQLGIIQQDKFEDGLKRLSTDDVMEYCRLQGLNPEKFFSGISYSYWELMGGYNRTIVADSAIPNRYHICTKSPREFRARSGSNYVVVENGKVVVSKLWEQFSKADTPTSSSVDFYETVRRLNRFDDCHCPIIEAQTIDNIDYFLQYHRATDFNERRFSLKRKVGKDGMEAKFVRVQRQRRE